MSMILKKIIASEGLETNYVLIPRAAIKLREYDIIVMADCLEDQGMELI